MSFQNVGEVDRAARVFVGILLLAAGILLTPAGSSYGPVLAFIGLMVLVSGLMRFCILYVPFGFSTAEKVRRSAGCCADRPVR